MQYSNRGFKSTKHMREFPFCVLHTEFLLIHLKRKSELFELAFSCKIMAQSADNFSLFFFLINQQHCKEVTGTTGRFIFLFCFPGISSSDTSIGTYVRHTAQSFQNLVKCNKKFCNFL